MSERLARLAARRRLLLARSELHRLELRHGFGLLQRSLLEPRNALALAASAPVRPLLFGAVLLALGRRRLGRMLRGAMAALALAKALRSFAGK
jgi:hypothetical protein